MKLSKYKTVEEAYNFGYDFAMESLEYGTCSQSVDFEDVPDEIYDAFHRGEMDAYRHKR